MNTVKKPLTPRVPSQRRRDVVENDEFAAFARRIIRAHGRRVAAGDVEALRDLVALSTNIDEAIGEAVVGLRAFGYSWSEIGTRLGISKQAAQQRWGGEKP
ncbi:hypothetical protein AB0N38_27810 [Micromonospora aurantiaca]|uniref:Uncharacterized protein n=1 Tax=Micromonospora sp. HUAS YX12 TaxID=3156396 RepID=A0AAU7R2T8_9ACTN|nr:hypothetical protein [Micromonospora sp. C72]MBQ1044133.1 hypothetical protein [Micromonospora sp. C72]